MRILPQVWLVALSAAFLFAADPVWKNKQAPQWDEEDVRQLLFDSPWAKTTAATRLPELTPAQRSDGGATGGGKGAGLNGLTVPSIVGWARQPANSITSTTRDAVTLRWESALPIRVAEMKAHEIGAAELQSGQYAIGVYQVPGLKADQKSLPGELRKVAALKRAGKKDLKPSHVEVLPEDSGHVTVVYLFPRSAEITQEDGRIEFAAQIGRLYVSQYFYLEEMWFQGKLEL